MDGFALSVRSTCFLWRFSSQSWLLGFSLKEGGGDWSCICWGDCAENNNKLRSFKQKHISSVKHWFSRSTIRSFTICKNISSISIAPGASSIAFAARKVTRKAIANPQTPSSGMSQPLEQPQAPPEIMVVGEDATQPKPLWAQPRRPEELHFQTPPYTNSSEGSPPVLEADTPETERQQQQQQLPLPHPPPPPPPPQELPVNPNSLGADISVARMRMMCIPNKSNLDDGYTGGAHRELAKLICKIPIVDKQFFMFTNSDILDNMAGQGVVSQELFNKTEDELNWPTIHTSDPELDPLLVPQANMWSLLPVGGDTWPINCARMPLDKLDYLDNLFDIAITIGSMDYYRKPYGDANIREIFRVLRPGGIGIWGHVSTLCYCRKNSEGSIAPHQNPVPGDQHTALFHHVGLRSRDVLEAISRATGEDGIQLCSRNEGYVHLRAATQQNLFALIWTKLFNHRNTLSGEENTVLAQALANLIQDNAVEQAGGYPGVGVPLPYTIVVLKKLPKDTGNE